jgi:hypothetical protein
MSALPAANIGAEQRVGFAQRIVDGRETLTADFDVFATQRAATLESQHNRVRTESSSAGRATVSAHHPVDVLGAYILLPT